MTLLSYSNHCNPETYRDREREAGRQGERETEKRNLPRSRNHFASSVCVLLHTSAYVSIRMCTFAYVSIRNLPRHRNRFASSVCVLLHTSAYVCVRLHTSAYGTCQDIGIALLPDSNHNRLRVVSQVKQHLHPSAYVSIRQHTSADCG